MAGRGLEGLQVDYSYAFTFAGKSDREQLLLGLVLQLVWVSIQNHAFRSAGRGYIPWPDVIGQRRIVGISNGDSNRTTRDVVDTFQQYSTLVVVITGYAPTSSHI